MTNYAVPPAPERTFAITKHCDLAFSIRRVENGEPVDIAAGVTIAVYVDIDKTAPTKIDATISGALAAITIGKDVLALAKSGTRLQVVVDGALDTPLMVGRLERHDG